MAAAEKFKLYDNAKGYVGDGTIDLSAGDAFFRWILVLSGYTEDLTDDTYADVSGNEHANANGYTTGGIAVAGSSWTEPSAGIWMFDANDPVFNASGGNIVARRIMLLHVAAGSGLPQSTDKLMATCLMDSAPADVTAIDGNPLTVQIHANGIFRLSGGNVA